MTDAKICRRALISGKVQGMGYRYHTRQQALRLGVKGWVRNLEEGRVEAWVEGDRNAVEAIVQWFHQGPAAAIVDAVALNNEPLQQFAQFEIRRGPSSEAAG